MTSLLDWFNQQRDTLTSRYQLSSIRGMCPAFDRLDYEANHLDPEIKMECISSQLLQKIQNQIRYGSIPIPDHPATSRLNQLMRTLEKNLERVDEMTVDMHAEMQLHASAHSEPLPQIQSVPEISDGKSLEFYLRRAHVYPEQACKKVDSVLMHLFEVNNEDYYTHCVEWIRQALTARGRENLGLHKVFANRKLAKHVIPRILAYPDGHKFVPASYRKLYVN